MTAPLVDPALAAWQAKGPDAFLEQGMAAGPPPLAPIHPLHTRHDIERDIAVAVVVAAALVVRELHKRTPHDVKQAEPVVHGAWRKSFPLWMRLTVPAIKQAYALGRVTGADDEITALAEDYAAGLGNYVGDTSSEAVLEGLNRQLNQKWSLEVAWRRASAGYGLDKRQMNAYLAASAKNADTSPDLVPAAARTLVDRLLLARATKIGADQAYTAEQTGKTLMWMRAYAAGQLPGAEREWELGASEHHCGTCNALRGQRVAPDEPFTLAGAKLWAPRAHPGCTCSVRLITADGRTIAKSGGPSVAGICLYARDTGRVLMLQRALSRHDPAGGKWEFPGGHLEAGEDARDGAKREWSEEVRRRFPGSADYVSSWLDRRGIYQGLVYAVPDESVVPSHRRGSVRNPDDPDGDQVEAIAWFDPRDLKDNPAVRAEVLAALPLVLQALPARIRKDRPGDPYDRDRDGRFSAVERRSSVATLEHPVEDPILRGALEFLTAHNTRRPESLTREQRSLTGKTKSLTGSSSLTSSRSLTEARSLTQPKSLTELTQQTAAPARQRANVSIHIHFPPLPPTPPGPLSPDDPGDFVTGWQMDEYFNDQFGGAIGAFRPIVDFGSAKEYYQETAEMFGVGNQDPESIRIEGDGYASPWAAGGMQVDGLDHDEWNGMLDQATPIWHHVQAPDVAEDVLGELHHHELQYICGRAFWPEHHSEKHLRASIQEALESPDDENQGLRSAYADYVTFVHPEVAGQEGEELGHVLSRTDAREMIESEPPVVFRLKDLVPGDDLSDLRGTYDITNGDYLSAIELREKGRSVPYGHLAMRQVVLEAGDNTLDDEE